ncbi:hypothetical protein Ciccas_014333, partial [Cichlidogyrus casuarinus]
MPGYATALTRSFISELLGVSGSSVQFEQQNSQIHVKFDPPLKGYFTKIVIRACLREAAFVRANNNALLDSSSLNVTCEDHQ